MQILIHHGSRILEETGKIEENNEKVGPEELVIAVVMAQYQSTPSFSAGFRCRAKKGDRPKARHVPMCGSFPYPVTDEQWPAMASNGRRVR